jgi:hypothetical protein
VDAGGGRTVKDLFADPPALLDYLVSAVAKRPSAGPETGKPLIAPGNPDKSALVRLLRRPGHPMNVPFRQVVPGLDKTGLQIVEEWIASLA